MISYLSLRALQGSVGNSKYQKWLCVCTGFEVQNSCSVSWHIYTQQKMKGEYGWFGTSLFQLLFWEAEVNAKTEGFAEAWLLIIFHLSQEQHTGKQKQRWFPALCCYWSTNVKRSVAIWSNNCFPCKSKGFSVEPCKQKEWILRVQLTWKTPCVSQ